MNKRKAYTSVAEMVHDLAEDKTFADDFENRLARRQVVKRLFALRCSRGMSQKDVADKFGCTQSRISKLESDDDSDLRLGDLRDYAAALGLEMRIVLSPEGQTAVEEIKYHAQRIEQLLGDLAKKKSKQRPDGSMPPIQIESPQLETAPPARSNGAIPPAKSDKQAIDLLAERA
jgi:transcriptional regulator with XRE-family HTH domain